MYVTLYSVITVVMVMVVMVTVVVMVTWTYSQRIGTSWVIVASSLALHLRHHYRHCLHRLHHPVSHDNHMTTTW